MLVKIPGTEKWINPAHVISVCSWRRHISSGNSIDVTRIETSTGSEETTASVEEVVNLLNLEIWIKR